MDSNQQAQIEEVFGNVLETIAFMFGDAAEPEGLSSDENSFLRVSMNFKGPRSGSISIIAPEGICGELASNIMGLDMDDEVEPEQGHDALKELLNVACGQILTAMEGDQVVFDLSIPELESLDSEGWRAATAQPETLGFEVDDYPVLLNFRMN